MSIKLGNTAIGKLYLGATEIKRAFLETALVYGIISFFTGIVNIGTYFIGGRFRIYANPSMIWYNGSTYSVGYEDFNTNNQVWITKQTGKTLLSYEVGSGTSVPDSINHAMPIILRDNSGYLYVIQNISNADSFRYWKSDYPELDNAGTPTGTFTLVGSFSANAIYIGLLKQDGFDCKFITRAGSPEIYSQSIISLNLDTGVNSTLQITDVSFVDDIRHYPVVPIFYGQSDYRFGGINHRNNSASPLIFYKLSLWITSDFNEIENIGQTWSKDVGVSGAITDAELDSNFAIVGSDAVNTAGLGAVDTQGANAIQINDDLYVVYRTDTNEHTIFKFTVGTATAVASYVIPHPIYQLLGGASNSSYLYYNGSNIVMTLCKDAAGFDAGIYTINLDLTNFTFIRDLVVEDTLYIGMPSNLDQVTGEYLIWGHDDFEGVGDVPYIITNNKWFN